MPSGEICLVEKRVLRDYWYCKQFRIIVMNVLVKQEPDVFGNSSHSQRVLLAQEPHPITGDGQGKVVDTVLVVQRQR